MANERVQKTDMIGMTDFLFHFCEEKKKGNGEDAFVFSMQEQAVLVGVLDGCGGSGAAKYPALRSKTGAFLASRAAAAAYLDWFSELRPGEEDELQPLKERILEYLGRVEKHGASEESKLMGRMSKKLPTTAASAVCTPGRGCMNVHLQWAGDSRVYLLDADGLAQLTQDDLGGLDAMQNLREDAALTNVISLTKDFTLHRAKISMGRPGLLFAATDGCFGYLSTPMEFEYLLLKTLQEARNVDEWEKKLVEFIGQVAGDDYTISGLAVGFGSLENLKQQLTPRTNLVYRTYIHGLPECSREEKLQLWEHYKTGYLRLLSEGD